MVPIERLHLIAGYTLVVSGVLVFFTSGFEMAVSWIVFGAMYISMSDIGEKEMSKAEIVSRSHYIRRFFGYLGALFGTVLMFYYVGLLL